MLRFIRFVAGGVVHVQCRECVDMDWLRQMVRAGQATAGQVHNGRCECCGA